MLALRLALGFHSALTALEGIEFAPDWSESRLEDQFEEPWIDDLTSDSVFTGSIFAFSACFPVDGYLQRGCQVFDMTYSDHDDSWTSYEDGELNHNACSGDHF